MRGPAEHAAHRGDAVCNVQTQHTLQGRGSGIGNVAVHLGEAGHQIPIGAVDDNSVLRQNGIDNRADRRNPSVAHDHGPRRQHVLVGHRDEIDVDECGRFRGSRQRQQNTE